MVGRHCLLASCALIGAAWSSSAMAQTPPADAPAVAPAEVNRALAPAPTPGNVADASQLGEIVVTATRRATNLQSTPIAVSAIDQRLIQQSSPRDLGDLAIFVPNFSAATISGFNAASFAMRGVGQNNIIVYFEPPVAVLVDDFVVPSVQTQLLDTFDVAQVEVLRGPQGTLFGKNTTGGAVTVRTKRPELDRLDVEARVQAGSFETNKYQAAVNVPIVTDKLAFRGVIGYEKSGGYYHSGACYGPVASFVPTKFTGAQGCGDGHSLGGKDVWNARAKLLWQPSPRFSVLAQYEWIRDQSQSVPSIAETPAPIPGLPFGAQPFLFNTFNLGASTSNPYGVGRASSDPLNNANITNRSSGLLQEERGHRVSVDGGYLNADYDIGFGTITSVTGYREQTSFLPSSYPGQSPVAADGTILSLFDANRADKRKTFQQEVRFASKLRGPFQFVAGGFYQHDNTTFCVSQLLGFLDLTGATTPYGSFNDNPYILCNAQRARSVAGFVEGTLKIVSGLTATAGVRYTDDQKTWYGRQQVFIPQLGPSSGGLGRIDNPLDANVFDYKTGVIQIRNSSSNPSFRGSLSYQATHDIFFYGTYSRGFKSGAFNDQIGAFTAFGNDLAAFAQAAQATNPEKADSYEIGVKTELFDRRLRANVTGFYVDYSNLQKQIVVPLVVGGQTAQVTRFFNAASATVKGVEGELTAVPIEHLTLRGVLGYQDGKYNKYVTPLPAGYDLATAPLDRAPQWQWTADATYQLPLGRYKMIFDAEANYVSRNLYTQSITSPAENTFLNARTLINASITLAEQEDRYYLRVVGRNLTDKRYKTATQVVGGLWAFAQYGPPRYVGAELGFKFGNK